MRRAANVVSTLSCHRWQCWKTHLRVLDLAVWWSGWPLTWEALGMDHSLRLPVSQVRVSRQCAYAAALWFHRRHCSRSAQRLRKGVLVTMIPCFHGMFERLRGLHVLTDRN